MGLFLWTPLLIMPKYFGVYGAWGSFPISDILGSVVSGAFMIKVIRELRRDDAAIKTSEAAGGA
jgi:Na+-driven multidrug efflux pump